MNSPRFLGSRLTSWLEAPWVLLGVTFIFAGCATAPLVGPAGHVILDAAHAGVSGYWQPSEDQVRALEGEMARLFVSQDGRISGLEHAKLSEYVVKYYGATDGGRRLIIGRGVHRSLQSLEQLREISTRPDTLELEAFGGGYLFFTIAYDPATHHIDYVRANAAL